MAHVSFHFWASQDDHFGIATHNVLFSGFAFLKDWPPWRFGVRPRIRAFSLFRLPDEEVATPLSILGLAGFALNERYIKTLLRFSAGNSGQFFRANCCKKSGHHSPLFAQKFFGGRRISLPTARCLGNGTTATGETPHEIRSFPCYSLLSHPITCIMLLPKTSN